MQKILLLFSCLLGVCYSYIPVETFDCGASDKWIQFNHAGIKPDPIVYPGSIKIDADMEVLKDLPSENFFMRMQLIRLNPKRMIVPCFQGMGSCTYDVCNFVIPNNQKQFCAFGACKCPLLKKGYKSDGLDYDLPKKGGPIFQKLLEGDYNGNLTFFDNQTKQIYGCLGMKFSIKVNGLLKEQ